MTSDMRAAVALVVLMALGVGGAACAKARASAVMPDGPPLQVPEPPPRVVTPVQELVSTPPSTEIGTAPVAIVPPTPPRPVAEPRTQPPAAASPVPTVPAVPRELRTAPLTAGESERSIREVLAQAARDISRVEYAQLSPAGRTQYDQAMRFRAQADEALRQRNLVFAATLADKAAALAAELLGR
jgi:hypothetical protein